MRAGITGGMTMMADEPISLSRLTRTKPLGWIPCREAALAGASFAAETEVWLMIERRTLSVRKCDLKS